MSTKTLVPLLELFQSCVRQLSELSDLVAEPLSDIERRVLIALITIDVHNRCDLRLPSFILLHSHV